MAVVDDFAPVTSCSWPAGRPGKGEEAWATLGQQPAAYSLTATSTAPADSFGRQAGARRRATPALGAMERLCALGTPLWPVPGLAAAIHACCSLLPPPPLPHCPLHRPHAAHAP